MRVVVFALVFLAAVPAVAQTVEEATLVERFRADVDGDGEIDTIEVLASPDERNQVGLTEESVVFSGFRFLLASGERASFWNSDYITSDGYPLGTGMPMDSAYFQFGQRGFEPGVFSGRSAELEAPSDLVLVVPLGNEPPALLFATNDGPSVPWLTMIRLENGSMRVVQSAPFELAQLHRDPAEKQWKMTGTDRYAEVLLLGVVLDYMTYVPFDVFTITSAGFVLDEEQGRTFNEKHYVGWLDPSERKGILVRKVGIERQSRTVLETEEDQVRWREVYPTVANTESRLSELSAADLRVLRNTVFAWRGHSFGNRDLRAYFEQQPWYVEIPGLKVTPEDLTSDERELLDLVRREEARQ